MKERITQVLERWFLSEPALFQVLCTHSIEPNPSMPCPVRSGARKVEYNPAFLEEMGDEALDQALRTEAIRILLKSSIPRTMTSRSGASTSGTPAGSRSCCRWTGTGAARATGAAARARVAATGIPAPTG